MPLPLIAWVGLAALGYGGYKAFSGASNRFPGDAAKVGDDVFVAPSFLSQATLPVLPPGTIYVIITVKGGDSERVQGPITGFGDQKIPGEVGSFVVQRKDIFKVMRGGKVIAFQPGAKVGAEG
jgi:hypothetical protein